MHKFLTLTICALMLLSSPLCSTPLEHQAGFGSVFTASDDLINASATIVTERHATTIFAHDFSTQLFALLNGMFAHNLKTLRSVRALSKVYAPVIVSITNRSMLPIFLPCDNFLEGLETSLIEPAKIASIYPTLWPWYMATLALCLGLWGYLGYGISAGKLLDPDTDAIWFNFKGWLGELFDFEHVSEQSTSYDVCLETAQHLRIWSPIIAAALFVQCEITRQRFAHTLCKPTIQPAVHAGELTLRDEITHIHFFPHTAPIINGHYKLMPGETLQHTLFIERQYAHVLTLQVNAKKFFELKSCGNVRCALAVHRLVLHKL